MNRFPKIIISVSGILLGIISIYLFSGWYNIIPWAICALSIGYFSPNKKAAILKGILFGYFLFITYILWGYKGPTDGRSIFRFILFAMAFSLIGGIAAAAGSLLGYFIKQKRLVQGPGGLQ